MNGLQEFWHVRITFKDGKISERFSSLEEYKESEGMWADEFEEEGGIRKIEIEVIENIEGEHVS